MEPAPEQREVEGRGGALCLLVRGAPLASYLLVDHFPSCSHVVVVFAQVFSVFEQRLTRLAFVLVRVCLRRRCLSVCHTSNLFVKSKDTSKMLPLHIFALSRCRWSRSLAVPGTRQRSR